MGRSKDEATRVSPSEARERVNAGARLICAYEEAGKCEEKKLEPAMSLAELQREQSELSKDAELIFYCA